ncbi:AraC family transcriptional regulator ligand-binding domain-containing protein [Aliisedimentitalea scapharcae]|uniref:AraC family transcriptional regulator ligand-binding domain-containing protein n=1 Tax=Aliisedimentitalea scapharcae TaxID=1524259 RepID=A0ABZ2XZE0_9RHOB
MTQGTGRFGQLIAFFQEQTSDRNALEEVLRRAGLPEKYRGNDNKINPEGEALFIRNACDILGDPVFGVRAGLNLGETGTLTSYINKYSQTLGNAIENSQRYHHIIDSGHSFTLDIGGNSASVKVQRANPSFYRYHRYMEYLMFAALCRMRATTQVTFYPIEIRFDHVVKAEADQIRKLAGFPVVFGAETPEIILPLSTLSLPIPTYEPSLREHLVQYGDRLLAEHASAPPSLRASIEGVLAASLPGRIAPADEVAASVGMSRRTFARRLKDNGLSFRRIVDDLRCDLAKTYLKGGFSIAEVAFFLDYSDQAAFSTAFKRWTGASPSSFA